MRYKVLDELREISETRETIRLNELLRRLNKAKGKDTQVKIVRMFRGSCLVQILDETSNRIKVSITIVSSDYYCPINDNTKFYIVRVSCKDDADNEERYGFDNWYLEDDKGVTYKDIDRMNTKRGSW